ncbi:MAG TPA: alpha/beta fold hydrolase [Sphingomonadales bacterium]|nr:alpha/beta fold hydrolase [Sphingomonadales bacterium]
MSKDFILIPGLLCSHDLWLDQIDAFEADYDLTLFDHTRHDNLPDMVGAFLTDAPDRFTLAGLSMGGYIAFEIMKQAGERVEKLILLDSNARADRQPQIDMREDLIRRAATEDIRDIARELTPYLIHPDRLNNTELCDRIIDMAAEVGAEAFQRQQQALIARPDSRGFLPQILCPTLIICGMQDALTPPKVHREMADLIPGAIFHQIENCGHLSTMECGDEVNKLMADFLVK